MKPALESQIYYQYPGQTLGFEWPSRDEPTTVARILDDNTTQLYKYEYNLAGKVTKVIDPLDRETVFVYGTNNVPDSDPANGTGIDLLEVRQKTGPGTYD